jgi:hypothetical protein
MSVWELPTDFDWSAQAVCDYINDRYADSNADEAAVLGDLTEGLYWICHDWHGGQDSALYSILSAQLGFHPGCGQNGIQDAEEAPQYVYQMIQQAEGLSQS